jgi:hypothetical protein
MDMRSRFRLWEPRVAHVPFEWAAAVPPTSTALRYRATKSPGEVTHERLVDKRALELQVVEVFGERQLGNGALVLIERACFSLVGVEQIADDALWLMLTAMAMVSS